MKEFLIFKYNHLFPFIALISGLIILIFSLVFARNIECSYFLMGIFAFMLLFINYKTCLKSLVFFIVLGGIFFTITYFSSNNLHEAIYMVNRIGGVCLGVIPGASIEPGRLTRNMMQFKMPRSLTIGMLIVSSFVPVLMSEISRIKEAMKVRGSFNFFNIKILYRAFFIPFITRIINISDTLSLSIETRAFDLKSKNYSLYKKVKLHLFDFIFLLGIVTGVVLTSVL